MGVHYGDSITVARPDADDRNYQVIDANGPRFAVSAARSVVPKPAGSNVQFAFRTRQTAVLIVIEDEPRVSRFHSAP